MSTLMKLMQDTRGELDEKALLITLFVIAAIGGLSTLGTKVSQVFTNLSNTI